MGPSNWEKASIFMSAAAIVISIVMPIVGYLWLDPKLQELRHRAKLKLIKAYFNESGKKSCGLVVWNTGLLPATNITMVFQADGQWKNPPSKIEVDPPSPHSVQIFENSVVVHLDRALGQDQKISVRLQEVDVAFDAWLYSDQGEARVSSTISGATNHPIDRRERKARGDRPIMTYDLPRQEDKE